MKVIDIYNMIANGEKVPKYKLKSTKEDNYYWVDRLGTLVYSQSGLPDIFELTNIRYDILNEEIEIIEDTPKEDKKIEKLNEHYYHDAPALIDDMAHKINEIIDKINGE